MALLTVWRFDSSDGAGRAVAVLETLAREQAVVLDDAAVVEWEPSQRRPRTRELPSPVCAGSLGPEFWGLLFGLVFFVPLLGAAIGTAAGAAAGPLADVGIDDHFVNRVRDQVGPGTSALFVLGSAEAVDRVHAALIGGPRVRLIVTDLAAAQVAALREVFGD